jgi:dynein heavy chain
VKEGQVRGHWDKRLTSFQKLLFIKAFHEEMVVLAVTDFVRENLGQMFIEPPATDLPTLFEDMSNTTPLVFVLSTGSDPMGAFLRFAREKNYVDRFLFCAHIFVLFGNVAILVKVYHA